MAHDRQTRHTSAEDETIDEDLWTSPSGNRTSPKAIKSQLHGGGSSYEKQESREEELTRELESVQKVNAAIEGVIESLEKARANMKTVNQTVNSASTLLNMWTRILSQTEHNQRLILNPSWQGASQDLADLEQEALARQQAVERREIEEQERKAALAKKLEDDERRRPETATHATKAPGRSRGRSVGRGSSTVHSTPTGYVAVGGQSVSRGSVRGSTGGTRRAASGIGRGIGSSRGRGPGG